MKPIIVLTIVAVAAAALATGSLNNNINLDVQQFGVGEETIYSPINSADVRFDIVGTLGNMGYFKNYIKNCKISSPTLIEKDAKIFCKLTNIDSEVVAEGNKILNTHLDPFTETIIPINDPNIIHSLVQDIHDVLVVVQAP